MEKQKNGIGRRKAAVTRVFLSKGEGSITVNDKDYKVYFPLVYLQNQVERPFKTVDAVGKFDVKINAMGGGVKGQAEAAMLGIARILIEINPEFRPALKAAGLLKQFLKKIIQIQWKIIHPYNSNFSKQVFILVT